MAFDWERAAAGLSDGTAGISQIDAGRLAKKRAQLEEEQTKRRNVADDFDLEQKRTRAPYELAKLNDEQETRGMDLGAKRAEFDPTSDYSKSFKNSLATQMRGFGNTLAQRGSPDAQLYIGAAENIEKNGTLTVPQILSSTKPLTDAAGFNLKALHDQATESMSKAGLGIQQAQLGETRRMHSAQIENMDADNARAFEATIKKPQEKLNADINNLEVGKDQMKEIQTLKNKVNTGPISSFFLDKLGLGKFDEIKSVDRKELEAITARVFNKETKSIAGATVTPSEWARIEPMIPKAKGDEAGPADDDENFQIKLERAIKEADRLIAARRKEYQRTPGGGTVDTSIVAQESNAKAKPTMTARDKEALAWFNDPENKDDPGREAVARTLRKKGFIR